MTPSQPKTDATPTPWKWIGSTIESNHTVVLSCSRFDPEAPTPEDAALIVRAVNSHAALLASHQRLAEALQAFMALDKSFATICDEHLDEIAKKNPMGVAVKLARAALATKEIQS